MNDNYTEKKFEKFIIISCYKKDEHSAVYLAEHIYLDKKVILKVLNVKTLSDETRIDRFKREAKILAKLEHTNIIKVFDFGIYKDYFYISFEYFESDNLREVFNKGELAIEQKENLFVQMLRGLNYAHQKGIIHRDIKPENILVNKNFKLKITDFGLALPEFENFLTKQYSLLGTPAYMSPEQIKGEKLAHKSDLFSLGIVTYELFKGKNPFLGKDVNECVNNILSLDEKNLSKNIETIPQPINKILVKLLSKDISLRFQSATEVLSELDAIEGMTFVNNGHHKNRKPLKYLVPIGLLLLFGFIFTFYSLIFTPNITDDNSHLNTKEFAEENKSKVIIKKESEENILTKEKQELNIENILKNSSNEIKLENSKKKIIDIEKLSTNKMLEVNEFGTLFVECYPWADVYLDDKKLETTPIKDDFSLLVGEHTLKLVHPDYPVYEQKINIKQNELANIKISLDTMFTYLDCKIFPWGEIYLDETKIGDSPLENPLRLIHGSYNLVLKNPKYNDFQKKIILKRKDTLIIKYNFNN